MTPVEEIRKAAALMRERATRAIDATASGRSKTAKRGRSSTGATHQRAANASPLRSPSRMRRASLRSWPSTSPRGIPAVALAVADWLEREAFRLVHDVMVGEVGDDHYVYECRPCGVLGSASKASVERWQTDHVQVQREADPLALAAARAYLGGAS